MTSNWSIERVDMPDEGSEPSKVVVRSTADSSQEYSFSLRYVNGVPSPSSCSHQRWADLDSKIKYRSNDIIISTYPKCGTTWTEQVVLLLLNGGDPDKMDPTHKNVFHPGSTKLGKIWPEAAVCQDPAVGEKAGNEFARIEWADFDSAPQPRVIKTHATARNLLGCGGAGTGALPEGVKTIVVSRNPLDACVSAYYHAFNPFKSGWPFDAWAAAFLAGNVSFGCWFEWTRGWRADAQANTDRTMFVLYEHMQLDAKEEVRRIAVFLGLSCDEALLDRVVLHSSFDSMKQQADAKGGDVNGHLRKGKSGDWRNHFNEQVLGEFRARYASEMAGTGLVFPIGGDGEPLA